MKSIETLQDRVAKATEFISKKESTIEKKSLRREKLIKQLADTYNLEWTGSILYTNELRERGFSNDDSYNIYWLQCDIESLEEDVKRLRKDVAEKQEKLEEYKNELVKVQEVIEMIAKEVPEAFKEARAELVRNWTEYDIRQREQMRKDRRELDYKEFNKRWAYTTAEALSHTDEELRKINEREADIWLLDLYNRVKAVTGPVTDARYVSFKGKALNGIVEGEKGKAIVETITAGGYNIQRLHYRVLVHKFMK